MGQAALSPLKSRDGRLVLKQFPPKFRERAAAYNYFLKKGLLQTFHAELSSVHLDYKFFFTVLLYDVLCL